MILLTLRCILIDKTINLEIYVFAFRFVRYIFIELCRANNNKYLLRKLMLLKRSNQAQEYLY